MRLGWIPKQRQPMAVQNDSRPPWQAPSIAGRATKLSGDGLQASWLVSGLGLRGRAVLQYGPAHAADGTMDEGEVLPGLGRVVDLFTAAPLLHTGFTNIFGSMYLYFRSGDYASGL